MLEHNFNFWDIEDGCQINARLKQLYMIQFEVHVIPTAAKGGKTQKGQRL